MLDVLIATMAFSVATFTLLLLLFQKASQAKSPLSVVLFCFLVLSSGPIIFQYFPRFTQLFVSVLPLVFFAVLPSLWFYHQALVSEKRWYWNMSMWKHYGVLPLAAILGIAILSLPSNDFHTMFFTDGTSDNPFVSLLSVFFFIAVVGWAITSCVYWMRFAKHTAGYRKKLKEVYANEQGKTLTWLQYTSLFIVFSWMYAFAVLLTGDTLAPFGVSETGVFVLLIVIVWFVSANGLMQRPGFEDESPPDHNHSERGQSSKTYERSALTTQNLTNIAEKLTRVLQQDKANLDHELTLAKLSTMVAEPPQYVSQTLSQHLGSNFFDFINGARIDEAKRLLVDGNQSVLDIAVATGFNSRSSFYKAFKQFAGETPSQYRKLHQSKAA